MEIWMPWPPSTNSIWRNVGRRTLLSKEARLYRNRARGELLAQGVANVRLGGRLAVRITLYPGDRRSFDIDNKLKALLDALTHSRVWLDDSQVDELLVVRGPRHDEARALVEIRMMEGSVDGSSGEAGRGGVHDAR